MEDEINYDAMSSAELAEQHLYYRDQKSILKHKYEAAVAIIDAELSAIDAQMMILCNEQDASSIKTDKGTIIRSLKTRYDTKDWDAMHSFILEHHAPYLLQKRINESAMKEFLESNPDAHPMGLNVFSEYKISVRKPSK